MTIQELYDFCVRSDIPLDSQIAVRSKDDYFVHDRCLFLDAPYFGNSAAGEQWIDQNVEKDENGDYECPEFLIIDTDHA